VKYRFVPSVRSVVVNAERDVFNVFPVHEIPVPAVMRFDGVVKNVFHAEVEAVREMPYPAVVENTPVPELYESPVAVLETRERAVEEKSLIVEAVCVPVWFARL